MGLGAPSWPIYPRRVWADGVTFLRGKVRGLHQGVQLKCGLHVLRVGLCARGEIHPAPEGRRPIRWGFDALPPHRNGPPQPEPGVGVVQQAAFGAVRLEDEGHGGPYEGGLGHPQDSLRVAKDDNRVILDGTPVKVTVGGDDLLGHLQQLRNQ